MSGGFHEERFRKILAMVESGSLKSIRDLAEEFKLSASHLQHLFKAHTGARLGHRLAEYRLQKAAFLLLQSELSVKEIAFFVGYKHASSFVRAFERYFQRAPSDYRQEMLTERRFG
jgi:AraC-like DNA-binding protein